MTQGKYPLMLEMAGRRAVVVGAGPVAARRARGLAEAGALVTVIAPEACAQMHEMADVGTVTWLRREYRSGDLDDMAIRLVHTATGVIDVDSQVAADAEAARLWCVRADAAELSSAWTPAVVRDGAVVIAVSGGADPGRAKSLSRAIGDLLALGELPTAATRTAPGPEGGVGRVSLVGGGPGDPELISVRGRRLLSEADVVVADRLGPRALLEGLTAEIIDVGKTPGHHPMPQDEINELLVAQARLGRTVVRLKGGDPFVLGRGGEEAQHCLANGIDVEVVPGITSAVSVPAAAGIPVTHRGVTTSFVVASAHDGAGSAITASRDVPMDATLVLLMGVSALAENARSLIEAGRAGETPVAVIENGWMPEQRVTVGTLATIADIARERDVRSPAVVVVGPVVGLREILAPAGGVAARIRAASA